MANFAYLENTDVRDKRMHYPVVEYAFSSSGSLWKGFVYDCELIFILEGVMHLSDSYAEKVTLDSQRAVFLIPGQAYEARFEEDCTMIRFRLDGNFPLREYFRADNNELLTIHQPEKPAVLEVNDKLRAFLCSLQEECRGDALDALLAEIKRKELFHIFHKYYGRRDILSFLYPLFNENYSFISFVYNNYHQVSSVPQFARLANCGLNTFCERFKASFGVSTYRWIMGKRNQVILNELTTTKKPVKQIAAETGFSASQFRGQRIFPVD